jgi:ABC-2 type transport system permease protein
VVAALVGSAIAVATVDDLGAVSAGRLVETAVGALLLALALGAVSLLAGAVTRRGATAVGWAAGFAVVSYALNYLAQIWTVAEPLGPLSIYHYFDPGRMLAQTGLDAGDALPLIGVTVVAGVLAHLAIGRGDVA